MSIEPIGIYPLYATRPFQSPKKSRSTSKKSKVSDSKSITREPLEETLFVEASSAQFQEGDLESSEQWFRTRTEPVEVGSGFDEAAFVKHIQEAEKLENLYGFNTDKGVYNRRIYQSFKNISLPEALLYHAILKNPNANGFYSQLSLQKWTYNPPIIEWKLYIQFDNQVQNWILRYHLDSLKVDLLLEGKPVGHTWFRIRGFKVEEIEGILHKQKFLLDPVWHPTKRGVLREELFRFGDQSLQLLYRFNEIYSIGNPQKKLKIKHTPLQKTHSKTVVRKEVSCLSFQGIGQLLYLKGILMPICAEWKLHSPLITQ